MIWWQKRYNSLTTIWWYKHYFQDFSATTQGLNDSIACGQSNGTTIQVKVFDIIQKFWHWEPNNIMNKCYNNKISEKATMQIEK